MAKKDRPVRLAIVIGSESDLCFIKAGLEYLDRYEVRYEVVVSSTHREPQETGKRIISILKNDNLKVIIGGAATATGLPGVIAGYLKETRIMVFGVRFVVNPLQAIIEDASFGLSSMPKGVPLAYTGFNEKGFLHACMLAVRVIKS